jgi:hypothetical protein
VGGWGVAPRLSKDAGTTNDAASGLGALLALLVLHGGHTLVDLGAEVVRISELRSTKPANLKVSRSLPVCVRFGRLPAEVVRVLRVLEGAKIS